jgi:RNA polymerase sigma factor (sigma-70 family)
VTSTQIVSGVQSRNPEAETALFNTVWKYRHSRNIDEADAEDLAQQAVVKCWQAIRSGEIRNPAAILSFAGTVQRNIKYQWLRHARTIGLNKVLEPVDHNTPERNVIRDEQLALLSDALAWLSDRDRKILLRWAQGETLRQIGEDLGMTMPGVKTAHHRAKQEIRKRISGRKTST